MAGPVELPAPVNRHPLGLLDLFGIKSGGKYPRNVLDSYQPTIDALLHIANLNCEEYALTTTVLTPNNYAIQQILWTASTPTDITAGVSLVVPTNEAWLILLYNVRAQYNAVAGSTLELSPEVTPITGSHRNGGPLQGFNTSDGAYSRGGGRGFEPLPAWALPGSTICTRLWGGVVAAGGTGTITGSIRFLRLRL